MEATTDVYEFDAPPDSGALFEIVEHAMHSTADDAIEDYEWDVRAAYETRQTLESIGSAVKAVRDEVDKVIAERLGGGVVRFGDRVVKVRSVSKRKFRDLDGLVAVLDERGRLSALPIVASMTPLVKGIRAIAAELSDDDNDAKRFERTYVETIWGDDKVQIVPVEKAAKRDADLPEGEVVKR